MFKRAAILLFLVLCFGILRVGATVRSVGRMNLYISTDTIPATKPDQVSKEQDPPAEITPVIKQVPKSRRQMKPLVLPKINATKPRPIIQPRIIIKTGLLP